MSESGPKPEQEPRPIQEMLASREEHEGTLNEVVAEMKDSGFTRAGESVTIVYPGEDNAATWEKRIHKFRPAGAGRGVAEIISRNLTNPPKDVAWSAKFGNDDALVKELKKRGYVVKSDIDFDMEGETHETLHVIYEKA